MKTKKPVNVRIVERSFYDGSKTYEVEVEHVFLGIISWWKRDKKIECSYEFNRDFNTYAEAERHIEQNYKNYALLEDVGHEEVSCMW